MGVQLWELGSFWRPGEQRLQDKREKKCELRSFFFVQHLTGRHSWLVVDLLDKQYWKLLSIGSSPGGGCAEGVVGMMAVGAFFSLHL